MPSKKPTKKKRTQECLANLAGWICEGNTFSMIDATSRTMSRKDTSGFGLIRGPDYTRLDGGFVSDPPHHFPFEDALSAWSWLHIQDNIQEHHVLPFDVKTSIYYKMLGQVVSILLVVHPQYPDYLCIMPSQSYKSLRAVQERLNDSACGVRNFEKALLEYVSYPPVLALFAVHRDLVPTAIDNLLNCMLNQVPYLNPSNLNEFHGWSIFEDHGAQQLLETKEHHHSRSVSAVQTFRQFLNTKLQGRFEVIHNPFQPLICDFILRDVMSGDFFFIEHKSSQDQYRNIKPEYGDPKYNWHFLFFQVQDDLYIYHRGSRTEAPLKTIKSKHYSHVNFQSPNAGIEFASAIESKGREAKNEMRKKWRDFKIYDDSINEKQPGDVDLLGFLSKETSRADPDRRQPPHGSIAQCFTMLFCNAFNVQCWQLGRLVCLALVGNPCGDAVIVNHVWTSEERDMFEADRKLPISLVSSNGEPSPPCVVVRFLPHHMLSRVNSAQAFEPGRRLVAEIPACVSQSFVYIASTGGVPSPNTEFQLPNSFVLLPSGSTNWVELGENCGSCDEQNGQRQWKYLQRYSNLGNAHVGCSMIDAPYLNRDINALEHIYNFKDGSVHDYFVDLLLDYDSDYITRIFGPSGILQKQWNHGAKMVKDEISSATDTLLQRVICTLPPGMQILPAAELEGAIQKKASKFTHSNQPDRRRMLAQAALTKDNDWGISLKDLLALSGFQYNVPRLGLKCDHCPDENSCRYFRPEKSPQMKTIKCGPCIESKKRCTFNELPLEIVDQLLRHEHFRRHVPCHRCWALGEECDNLLGPCSRCTNVGLSQDCVREKCNNYMSPVNDNCNSSCDRAHYADGYMQVTSSSRLAEGYNKRELNQKIAKSPETRIAVCNNCWDNGIEDQCDNGTTCIPCRRDVEDGVSTSCRRMRCPSFAHCSGKTCKFAHATHNFQENDLEEHNTEIRGEAREKFKAREAYVLKNGRA